MSRKFAIGSAAFGLLIGAVVGIVALSNISGDRGSVGDWPDYVTAESLVESSAAIVVGEYLGERSESVEIFSPTGVPSGLVRQDVIRTFRVQESLKGSFEVGKTVDVWHSKALDDRSGGSYDRSQDFELVTMETGQSYALFLIPVEREGSPAWAQTGHPELAQVRGDELVFLATDRYVEAVRERGLSLSGSSESPFAITLSQLREMAR